MTLRIAQLSKHSLQNGGLGGHVVRLCAALTDAGHEVVLIHADDPGEAVPLEAVSRVRVPRFDEFGETTAARRTAAKVLEHLERFRPDLVHVQANNNFRLEAELRARYPVVKSLHNYDFCPSGSKYHFLLGKTCSHPSGPLCVPRMIYKRCLLSKRPLTIWRQYRRFHESTANNAHYSKLVVYSEYFRRQAIENGYRPDQPVVCPYFVDLPTVRPYEARRPGEILFVGRIVPEKGLGLLLDALGRVQGSWHLTVAGDGHSLVQTKRRAARLGLASQVDFVGWATPPRLDELYRASAVVAFSSRLPEPFGIVGIEAMSHARPVVAFRVGGIPEWLEDGRTGLLAPAYDTSMLASCVEQLLGDPDRAQAMGVEGRRRAATAFSPAAHLDRLLDVYETVLAAHRAGRSPIHAATREVTPVS